jgi:hypothetical protein
VRFRTRPNAGGRLDQLAASLRARPFQPPIPDDGAGAEEWTAVLEVWAAAGLFSEEPAGAEALERLRRALVEARRSPGWVPPPGQDPRSWRRDRFPAVSAALQDACRAAERVLARDLGVG